MKMKKVIFFLGLFSILFEGCSKCKDVSVGSVETMPNGLVLLNNLQGKNMIYKDSLGSTITFKAESGITNVDYKVNIKVLCQEAFNSGVEFLNSKMKILNFTSKEVNVNQSLNIFIINKSVDTITSDTTLLYDILECKLGNSSLSSIFFQVETSKRGTIKPDILTHHKPIDELTILGKKFKNIIVKNNDLKSKTIEPLELYFTKTQGVVAMRLLDGRLFVLDKVE